MEALRIGGLTPFTTVDFPGCLAAVVFCQGCPWRCGYCHNPQLLPVKGSTTISWAQVRNFLEGRRGLLDGVVFSGGEPTLQTPVVAAVREVKLMGFRTGLHTGGAYPVRLAALLPHLDWVGFDIKAHVEDYKKLTGRKGSGAKAISSLSLLLDSGINYEVRTTVYPGLDEEGLLSLAQTLAAQGVRRYAIQECRPAGVVDRTLRAPLSIWLRSRLRTLFESFLVRCV